jgi:NAD+ diphosphatase
MWPVEPDDFQPLVHAGDDAHSGDAWYFAFADGQIACLSEQGVPRPMTADDFRWLDVEVLSRHFLGRYGGRACFALEFTGRLPEGFVKLDLRGWLGRVDGPLFYLAGRAKQIIDWNRTHQYCGQCGAEMVDHEADRAKHCHDCGLISYPRLSPSIIVLVRKGDQMLLARNAGWPNGMFSTLAGFVEPGESIEQTVHREVFEEVGLRVTNLKYFGSQSWPFPNSLMLGFHADYASGEIVCEDEEIAEAHWFDWDDLPNAPPGTAISRWLIDAFIEEKRAEKGG